VNQCLPSLRLGIVNKRTKSLLRILLVLQLHSNHQPKKFLALALALPFFLQGTRAQHGCRQFTIRDVPDRWT